MLTACLDPNITTLGPTDPGGGPPPQQPGGGGGGDGGGSASPVGSFPSFDAGCILPSVETAAPTVPVSEPPAVSGGTMAVLADGRAVVADSDRDQVWIFASDLSGYTGIALQPGDEPGRVVAGPAGHVFVALRRAGQVAELDLAGARVLARHDACSVPRGLSWDDAYQTLSIACGEGTLVQLQILNAAVQSRSSLFVAEDLRDVVPVGNALWVTTFRTAQVYEVVSGSIVTPLSGPASSVGFDPRVAWRSIASLNGALMVHQETSNAGAQVAVTCNVSTYGGESISGPSAGLVHAQLTRVQQLAGGGSTSVTVGPGLQAVLPVDVAESSTGEIAIAAAGEAAVWFITPIIEPVTNLPGLGVTQVALDGMPVAVGYSNGRAIVFLREPAQLVQVVAATSTVTASVAVSATSVASTGFDLFHTATPAHVACASCHPEAGEDGNVWPLPEGLVRTPSLRGGLTMTAPFHWGGEETSLSLLMFDIFGMRMGGPAESDARVNELGRWLDAQPARRPPALDSAAIDRGRALFGAADTGCTACHTGPLGTNNTTVSVGTGGPLQVPRLVELAYRAPFLHDGRAATLGERFSLIGGGDAHGHTSQLTDAEISDLITYLRSR
jgi:mono/diheme cytochrome c family protein